jgi:hypothetical protein
MQVAYLFIFLCCYGSVSAQEATDVLARMQAVYNGEKAYSCNASYELFNGKKTMTAYDGYIYRSHSTVYQRMGQTEYIYAPDYYLEIDHQRKTAVLDTARSLYSGPVDIRQALEACDKVEIETRGTSYLVTLVIRDASAFPFSKMQLVIHAKEYNLESLDLFYGPASALVSGTEKAETIRMHITFSDLKIGAKPKKGLFSLTTYTKTGNPGLLPSGTIEGYTFSDNRIN